MSRRATTLPALAVLLLAILLAVAPVARAQQDTCSTLGFAPYTDLVNPNGVCSGHGTCEAGRCKCAPGWTGRSDIVDLDGLDCHINELAISLLWVASIVINVMVLFVSAPRLRLRWIKFKQQRADMRRKGKHYGVFSNRGFAACVVFFSACQPACMLYGLLRIVKPDERLGFSFASTLLFAIARSAFYASSFLFQPALLLTLLKKRKGMERYLRMGERAMFSVCLFAALISWAPFVSYALGTRTGPANMGVWYTINAGMALQLIVLGLQGFYIKIKVVKAFDKSYKQLGSQKILDTRDAFVSLQHEVVVQCIFQCLIYIAFAAIPFLVGRHDYLLPVGWIAYSVIAKKTAFTQVADRKRGSEQTSSTYTSSHSPSKNPMGAELEDPAALSVEFGSSQEDFGGSSVHVVSVVEAGAEKDGEEDNDDEEDEEDVVNVTEDNMDAAL